jgi:hypothetical protein
MAALGLADIKRPTKFVRKLVSTTFVTLEVGDIDEALAFYGRMLLAGVLFSGGWIVFAAITWFLDRAKHGPGPRVTMG